MMHCTVSGSFFLEVARRCLSLIQAKRSLKALPRALAAPPRNAELACSFDHDVDGQPLGDLTGAGQEQLVRLKLLAFIAGHWVLQSDELQEAHASLHAHRAAGAGFQSRLTHPRGGRSSAAEERASCVGHSCKLEDANGIKHLRYLMTSSIEMLMTSSMLMT